MSKQLERFSVYDLMLMRKEQAVSMVSRIDSNVIAADIRESFAKAIMENRFRLRADEKADYLGNPLLLTIMLLKTEYDGPRIEIEWIDEDTADVEMSPDGVEAGAERELLSAGNAVAVAGAESADDGKAGAERKDGGEVPDQGKADANEASAEDGHAPGEGTAAVRTSRLVSVDVGMLLESPEQNELLEIIMDDSFPLKREYVAAKKKYEELKAVYAKRKQRKDWAERFH
jgi:hypothetical protein